MESERLLLREFERTDLRAVHEYAADADVVNFLEWGPNSERETLDFLEGALECRRDRPRRIFEFAVILKPESKLVGACGIRRGELDLEQADIGYVYNKQYWRQGIASEACRMVIDYGFDKLLLHRIYATCDSQNLGSAGVLRKSGMRQEGTFLQDRRVKGRWRDTLLFAILREEWKGASNG